MPRRENFHQILRIGLVQVGTHRDRHGRHAHVAVCTAPGCDWSGDYLNRSAAELAARTHRCRIR